MRVVPPGAARAGLGRPPAAVLRSGVPAAGLRTALGDGQGGAAGRRRLVSRAELDGLQDRLYQLRCALEDVQTLLDERPTKAELERSLTDLVHSTGRLDRLWVTERAADRLPGRPVLAVCRVGVAGRCPCPPAAVVRQVVVLFVVGSLLPASPLLSGVPSFRTAPAAEQAVNVAPPPNSARAVITAAIGRRICMPRPYEPRPAIACRSRRHTRSFVTVTQCGVSGWTGGVVIAGRRPVTGRPGRRPRRRSRPSVDKINSWGSRDRRGEAGRPDDGADAGGVRSLAARRAPASGVARDPADVSTRQLGVSGRARPSLASDWTRLREGDCSRRAWEPLSTPLSLSADNAHYVN